jgi:hypothetical protein
VRTTVLPLASDDTADRKCQVKGGVHEVHRIAFGRQAIGDDLKEYRSLRPALANCCRSFLNCQM